MSHSKSPSAVELLRLFDEKKTSAVEFAHEVIKREREHSDLNAVANFDPDLALAHASLSDEKRAAGKAGRLCGIPIIVKDNINTVSFPTTAGTPALFNHTPRFDAGVVSAAQSEDGYVAAKAVMHELAFGITSNNKATGAVRNPVDKSKIPGGSSGGTAAAVAASIFPVGFGTDTGASVRLPAALCGCYGFRPTVGRYSSEGIIPVSHTRDTAGPMANTIEDIALMDGVMSGGAIVTDKADLQDITIGVPTALYQDLEPAVAKAMQSVLRTLGRAGVNFVDIDLSPVLDLNAKVGFPVVLYEMMQEIPAFLRQHIPNVTFENLLEQVASPDVRAAFESQMGSDAVPEDVYRAAIDVHRPAMQAAYETLFRDHGLSALIFPTTPLRARNIGDDETVELNGKRVPTMSTYIRNTDFGSNLAVPGLSLPCPDVDGLPIGFELEGLARRDEYHLGLALSVQDVLTR